MSSMPLPTLTEAGRKSLDDHLKTVNNNDQFPAVFLGAANAKEVLYVNEMGNLDLNDTSKGKVGRDTSESGVSHVLLRSVGLKRGGS